MKIYAGSKQKNICLVIEQDDYIREVSLLIPELSLSTDFYYCSNYTTALSIITSKKVDLILLTDFEASDNTIDMVQFFHHIKSTHPVLLVSKESNFLSKYSFEYDNIIDSLIKPLHFDRLRLAFSKFRRFEQSKENLIFNKALFIKIGKSLRKFYLEEIMYIQAIGAYSKIFTPDSNFIVHDSIAHLERRLPQNKFIRIHKSYLIGLDHLTGLEKKTVLVEDTKIPIGVTYQKKLYDILKLF